VPGDGQEVKKAASGGATPKTAKEKYDSAIVAQKGSKSMGIEKYDLFKALLSLMEEMADVTNAIMSNYVGDMEIAGKAGDTEIRFQVSIENKEEETDA
jgi:hypothetical protein